MRRAVGEAIGYLITMIVFMLFVSAMGIMALNAVVHLYGKNVKLLAQDTLSYYTMKFHMLSAIEYASASVDLPPLLKGSDVSIIPINFVFKTRDAYKYETKLSNILILGLPKKLSLKITNGAKDTVYIWQTIIPKMKLVIDARYNKQKYFIEDFPIIFDTYEYKNS